MYEREEKAQSEYAPSEVASEETLVRIIYYPRHLYDDGKLKPETIPRDDLRGRGWSVYRREVAVASIPQLQLIRRHITRTLARDRSLELRGAVEAACQAVRNVIDHEGRRAFVVVDDAQRPDDPAHSAIRFATSYANSRQKQLREKLLKIFSAVNDLSRYYDCDTLPE